MAFLALTPLMLEKDQAFTVLFNATNISIEPFCQIVSQWGQTFIIDL